MGGACSVSSAGGGFYIALCVIQFQQKLNDDLYTLYNTLALIFNGSP